jgi:HEPN domain-containing protein
LLKARLIQLGQAIRKTHDLAVLSQLLQQADAHWSWDEDELEELSDGGVLSRYPGFDTSSEEMQKLTAIASRLRQALLGRLQGPQ